MPPSPGPSPGPKEHPEKPASSLADAVRAQAEQARTDIAKEIGMEPKKLAEDLRSKDPDKLGHIADRALRAGNDIPQAAEKYDERNRGSPERVLTAYNKAVKSVDRMVAVFKSSEVDTNAEQVEASQQKIEEREQYDTKESPPKEWTPPSKDVTWRDWSRARHAKKKLDEHPDWRKHIDETVAKYNDPKNGYNAHLTASTLITFMEMESGFNPLARNPSGATGLSQVMPSTWKKYLRERPGGANGAVNPGRDVPTDPKTAIDVVGWCIASMVKTINYVVDNRRDRNGNKIFPDNYKITDSQSQIRYLYMSYNNGPWGYLVLRRYLENKDRADVPPDKKKQYYDSLVWFQRRKTKSGQLEGEERAGYAVRVAAVASAVASSMG